MIRLPDLDTLTRADNDALILALWAQVQEIEGLRRRIAEFKARLGKPPKTSGNSSLPPSQGRKRYGKDRDSLFTFMTERGVPPTNNGSARDHRPSTIFRKVTNGFRTEWGSELYAGVRSTLNAGRRQGLSAFEAIQTAIDRQPLLESG